MKQLRKCAFVAAIALLPQVSWGQSVHGTGATNVIPVWTTGTTIGNSLMSQSGNNVSVNGSVTATSFSGAGSGLTLLNPANLSTGTANINITGNAATATNSSQLGGLASSAFARLAQANIFTTDQTIQGNLLLTGSINNAMTLQGNLTDSTGTGNQSANVIDGFGGNTSFPGNSVASGVVGATIAGGGGAFFNGVNIVASPNSVIADWGTVGGGRLNTSASFATVAGGEINTASNSDSTVAGGFQNTASGIGATVAGGLSNTASGFLAAVAGGEDNTASAEGATVAGGTTNTASALSATVAGGFNNTARGQGSFAAGQFAQARDDGAFVWGDNSTNGLSFAPVASIGPNSFVARTTGGVVFWTAVDSNGNPTTGATLPSGSGSWSSVSDRNLKANFASIDEMSLLAKLAAIPILTWNYKTQSPSIRHMGPVAQDFRAAFGLGEDDKHISTVDADGVALAGIQALYQQLEQLKEDRDKLAETLTQLQARLEKLEKAKGR